MINTNDFFDALSDETRRRLLALLVGDDELCVCELSHALDLPQPKVSRHLAVMRESGLLSVRREGLWVYYRIHSLLPAWAYRILDQMGQGCGAVAIFQDDRKRLKEMPNRPVRCCA
ncbi:MAG: metalloregulator ArsR/SmtB family transcription factor [Sulfurimicrobium sp.]|nr:metalloregulator ArsR/SmtB family transcription factor [Sulfurimicrobium sp.]